MSRTHVGALALATATALLVSSCGIGSSAPTGATAVSRAPELKANQKVSIVFESYNYGLAGPWTDTFKSLIAKFEKQYPNITVTAQKPQGSSPNPADDAISSVQNEAAAGNAPDVVQLGFSDLDFTVNELKAKPLDDLYGRSAVQANFDGQKYPYARTARTLGDWNGKTYGLPFVLSTPVLYYNADLFKKAGLNPNNPPKTWAQFASDAMKIAPKAKSGGGYVDCLTKSAKDWCFQSLVQSNGGQVLSSDRKKLMYADKPSVDAVTTMQKMVNSGATPKLQQIQALDAFGRGELGMFVESASVQGQIAKAANGKWTLKSAPMPAFTGHPVVTTNSGAALFMLSNDPAKQRAGWDLMKFLTSEDSFMTITENIGYLPLRPGLATDPHGLAPWLRTNPLSEPNLQQLNTMQPWVSMPGRNYQQIADGMMTAVEKVVYHDADPATTLQAAQQRGSELLPTK